MYFTEINFLYYYKQHRGITNCRCEHQKIDPYNAIYIDRIKKFYFNVAIGVVGRFARAPCRRNRSCVANLTRKMEFDGRRRSLC